MRVGCHLSMSGGFPMAARSAIDLGCEAMQIFSRSPRGGKAKPLDAAEVAEFRRICAEGDVNPCVVHVPYYINLAAADPTAQGYTREIIADDMKRAGALGVRYVVTHMGHSAASDAALLVANALDDILTEAHDSGVILLLENTAGQGSEIGTEFASIAGVIERCQQQDLLGLCLDTCHAFGGGYDLTDGHAFDAMVSEIRSTIGLSRLHVIHANDSKEPCGSHKDRHEHIGQGLIGVEGMGRVMRCQDFAGACAILETPLTTFEANLQNITALKALR